MKMKIVLTIIILVFGRIINAQITDQLLSKNKNVAYFDSLSVYKDLYPIQQLHEKIFIMQVNDTLLVNNLKLIVQTETKHLFKNENLYTVIYNCLDTKKNKYNFTIYFAYGHSYQGCLIAENTDMRYGFAHTF